MPLTKPTIQLKPFQLKNKTKTYILLLAVLGIWGLIGYKIISTLNPETPESPQPDFVENFKPQSVKIKDTFSIQTLEKDPFLGTLQRKNSGTFKKTTTTPQIPWPQISYGGLVRRENSKEQVFVVNINNGQYLLKKGQSIIDVSLLRGNSKEIVVRFQNHTKTFAIQK